MDSTHVAEYKHYTLDNTGLPYCYTQQLLIQTSKYYKLINESDTLLFRVGLDGISDKFDISVTSLFVPKYRTLDINFSDWINYKGNYPYSIIRIKNNKIFKR